MTKEREITVADFVHLTNECVGFGLLPTGEKMFELASRLAKQEAIAFLKWAVENHSDDYEGFGLNGFTDNREETVFVNHEEITLRQFFDLYTKHKQQ